VDFYSFLGMSLVAKLSFPDSKFDLYFLGYDKPGAVSAGSNYTDRQGLIELTHNHGSENDDSFRANNGNEEPHRGFGHVCVSVDNIQAACARLESAGYTFRKKLTDGKMKHIAFVLDPDGYWVEIVPQKQLHETEHLTETDVSTYRMVSITHLDVVGGAQESDMG
jgi:lactoylglutathione lyase